MDALSPEPPPARGDQRQTWLGLLVVLALFAAFVVAVVMVAP